MSHEPRRNNRPDFNEIFRHELGPCKAPTKKPTDEPPVHLRPGNPARWDDTAKHHAALWRLQLLKELEAPRLRSWRIPARNTPDYASSTATPARSWPWRR